VEEPPAGDGEEAGEEGEASAEVSTKPEAAPPEAAQPKATEPAAEEPDSSDEKTSAGEEGEKQV
jgi:hypothetical protein